MAKKISGSVGKGGKLSGQAALMNRERAVAELTRCGMTHVGARQVMAADPVTNPRDRACLAKIAEDVAQPGSGLRAASTSMGDEVGAFHEPTKHPG